jgi:hypothetical protein
MDSIIFFVISHFPDENEKTNPPGGGMEQPNQKELLKKLRGY